MEGHLDASDVFAAARNGDHRAVEAVEREAEHLAQLLASVSAVLDPELIVVGGGVGQNLDLLEGRVRSALAAISPLKPRFTVSELGSEAVVRGAIAIGVQRAKDILFTGITDGRELTQ